MPGIQNSSMFMSISDLMPDQQQERNILDDHGDNWPERHLNIKINQQITNWKEINSHWTFTEQKITNTTVLQTTSVFGFILELFNSFNNSRLKVV